MTHSILYYSGFKHNVENNSIMLFGFEKGENAKGFKKGKANES